MLRKLYILTVNRQNMVIELYIARHGQTIQNLKGIIHGILGGKLTSKGFEQTYNLGVLLKEKYIKKGFFVLAFSLIYETAFSVKVLRTLRT